MPSPCVCVCLGPAITMKTFPNSENDTYQKYSSKISIYQESHPTFGPITTEYSPVSANFSRKIFNSSLVTPQNFSDFTDKLQVEKYVGMLTPTFYGVQNFPTVQKASQLGNNRNNLQCSNKTLLYIISYVPQDNNSLLPLKSFIFSSPATSMKRANIVWLQNVTL